MTLELLSLVVSHKFKELDSLENTLFLSINRAKNLFFANWLQNRKVNFSLPKGNDGT